MNIYLLLHQKAGCQSFIQSSRLYLGIGTHRQEKKYRQIKLQRLQKVGIWAFRSLVHQINSLSEVLKLKQNFQIVTIVVTGKPHSILC